jgi:hypothetical protein
MSKDQKELLKRLDTLNNNIEILGKILAINIGKDALFKEKKQKEQIAFLAGLGLPRNVIASMVATTLGTVSVTKSQQKPKKKAKKENAEKTTENEQSISTDMRENMEN